MLSSLPMDFVGNSLPLSEAGLQACVDALGVDPAAIWTLLAVETKGCGFLPDRRPLILFERHVFRRQTKGVFDVSHPAISSPVPGGYLGGPKEYDRLQEALALNRVAALNSASWGIGQLMGYNAKHAGFSDVTAMVTAMQNGEDAQLSAVAKWVRANKLHTSIARHDWATFARGYNGPDFQKNQYDTRLASFFASFSVSLPSIKVRQAQMLLMFLGIDAGTPDGIAGKRTRSGVSNSAHSTVSAPRMLWTMR